MFLRVRGRGDLIRCVSAEDTEAIHQHEELLQLAIGAKRHSMASVSACTSMILAPKDVADLHHLRARF